MTLRVIQQELSYRKQIARQLRTQYDEDIYRPKYYTVTLKSRLRVTQDHCKRNYWTYHICVWGPFYQSAIVTIALCCTMCELFDVEYYRDLEMWVRGHSGSLKVVPFESMGTVSYSPSLATMAVSLAILEIFSVKEWPDREICVWRPSKSSIDHV